MSENERDDLPPELAAALRAERNRPPMDDDHARRIRLAVAAKLGPPPTPEGGSEPPEGGSGGAPPGVPASGGVASTVLSASHLAALVTGLATGVVVGALGHAALVTPASTEPRPTVLETAPAAAEPAPSARVAEPTSAEPAIAAPSVVDEPRTAPASAHSPEPEGRVVTTLAAERRLVDSARAALSQGRPDPALSALATHRRRFPQGSLAEERDALEVEALAAAGRREEAVRAAGRFDERYPGSLYRGRVRGAAGQ